MKGVWVPLAVRVDEIRRRISIGCQGWNYDDWVTRAPGARPVFYPRGTRDSDMLAVYARAFDTVEVDSTFYGVPAPSTIEHWTRRAPGEGFTFSLKLPREITHERLLGEGSVIPLLEFCERARLLGPKLAAILIQLPPGFTATDENHQVLAQFLARCPSDLPFSVEFRDAGWLTPDTRLLLAEHRIALALVEGSWLPRSRVFAEAEHPTADFAYVRWMGERDLERFDAVQRPAEQALEAWHTVISRLAKRVARVFCYFSNFFEGHAPASANGFKLLFGQPVVAAAELDDQPSLF